jgi:FkbM family methyltransferase
MRRHEGSDDPLDQTLAALGPEERVRQRESGLFDALTRGATRAVIFGCGPLGRVVLSGARAAAVEVVAFADNNLALHGTDLDGVPIMAPADAVAAYGRDAYFVVGVYNSAAPRKQLQDLGCERVVPYPAFFWRFASRMQAPGLDLPHRILASVAAIRSGYQRLADSKSRQEFAAQIAWRCSLDYDRLPPPDRASDIYFPTDLMRLSDEEVLVDCGAFDGDSIRLFRERTGGSCRHIYACEPDAGNRRALDLYLSSLPDDKRDSVSVFPFAVGNHDGAVFFNASGTAGSRITTDHSTASIECRRLDSLLEGIAPTIIKMDIEGAEPDAISGATKTIRASRPILAVCAYHACEHLWTLPALMSAALPEYRISLRRYAEECWETVYYAIPPERALDGSSERR